MDKTPAANVMANALRLSNAVLRCSMVSFAVVKKWCALYAIKGCGLWGFGRFLGGGFAVVLEHILHVGLPLGGAFDADVRQPGLHDGRDLSRVGDVAFEL